MTNVITQDIIDQNKLEFDRVTKILNGQGFVISKIKEEIMATRNKYASMIEIIASFGDQMTPLELHLYDVQCQAFIHSIFMYTNYLDPNGNFYINPVTPQSQTTDVTLSITLPHYTVQKTISSVDNIAIDLAGWNIYFGTMSINVANHIQLEAQYDTTQEVPAPYFSKEEFLTGVAVEIEKLLLFNSQICRVEQVINGALRYISELKNIGLYG